MTIVNAKECYINTNCYKNNTNITSIDLLNTPWVNNSMYMSFAGCSNLDSINNISQNVINMSSAFSGCVKLVNAPIIPNSVTNMSGTFYRCLNLINPPDMSNANSVTNMCNAFNTCSRLISTPVLPNSVTEIAHAFAGCHALNYSENIPYGITNMCYTFASCNKLVNAPTIPNTVTILDRTFLSCSNLINPPVINHCLNLTDVSGMFESCSKLTQIPELPPSVTKMGFAKYSAGATYGYAGGTNITTMCNIPNSVTDMSAAFWECFNLVNTTTIPNSVTNMSRTFSACLNLTNAPIIPDSVTVMTGTFERCRNLQGDICIQSSNVTAAANCFNTKVLAADIEYNKYVWIKPNTTTWNTFINAGYDTNGTQNKVFMREWDGTFSNLTVNVTPNTATVNIIDNNEVLTNYTLSFYVNSLGGVPAFNVYTDGNLVFTANSSKSRPYTEYVNIPSSTSNIYFNGLVSGNPTSTGDGLLYYTNVTNCTNSSTLDSYGYINTITLTNISGNPYINLYFSYGPTAGPTPDIPIEI